MNSRKRMKVLLNARSTRCPEDMSSLLKPLQEEFEVRVVRVDDPTTFSLQIEGEASDADVLVMGSGDGTMARSAGALIRAGLPVGLLPLGNANDLARGLGIPLDLTEACHALGAAQRMSIDVGCVNDHYFFNAATFGVGAAISAQMDAVSKKKWKRLSQVPRVIKAIRKRRPFKLQVEVEGQEKSFRSIHVTVANGRTIGGGVVVDSEARLDDRNLNLSSVQPQTGSELLKMAPAFLMGRREGHPRLDTLDGARMVVQTSRPLKIATDGDVVTSTPAIFETLPAAITFLVPADPAPSVALDETALKQESHA